MINLNDAKCFHNKLSPCGRGLRLDTSPVHKTLSRDPVIQADSSSGGEKKPRHHPRGAPWRRSQARVTP